MNGQPCIRCTSLTVLHVVEAVALYGMSLKELKQHKKLAENEDLMDHADRLELAANDFRITLTERRLQDNKVKDERLAISTHREVGSEVRDSVTRKNGIKPENLPKVTSIKPLVQKHRRQIKSGQKALE